MAESISVSLLSDYAGQYAPGLIRSLVNDAEFARQFPVDKSVTNAQKYPKLKTNAVLGPYTGSKTNTGGEFVLSDKELRVDVGQAVVSIDPEILRREWAGSMEKITEGRVPLERFFLDDFLKKAFSELNDSTFFKGDKANVGSNQAIKMIDGLEKDLLALVTATEITPVTTAAWNAGSGWGASFTDGNVIDGFKAVDNNLPVVYRNMKRTIFCSYDVFDKYCEHYRRRHGWEALFKGQGQDQPRIYLDGTMNKCEIVRATWLGTSSRILDIIDGAVRVGTDTATMASSIDIQKDGFVFWYLMKMVLGVKIVDVEGIRVNSLS